MSEVEEYNFKKIEKKWAGVFASGQSPNKGMGEKFYLLEMFPYPSGALHMGHMRNYSIGDTYKRFLEMKGYDVIYPMGYDSFGLPAENAAIKSGVHPRKWTLSNIDSMIEQQKRMGLSYQWERLVKTCSDEYIKWNQWFFLKFLEKGLAYRKESAINWCPDCGTVLANEQVVSGKCWRCDSIVESKKLKQWFFRITDYAEELLSDIDGLEWPEKVNAQQKNWLGKSHGVEIDFPLENGAKLTVFTTRPDTLWGATFMALSPDHPLINDISGGVKSAIEELKKQRSLQSDEEKEKFGVLLPVKAVNPVTGEKIPVFAANFVLMEYGTGAIMCVPAHDKRDFAFAKKYSIPVCAVISGPDTVLAGESMKEAFTESGTLQNSASFTGLDSETAKEKISVYLEGEGKGKRVVKWHLRDWLVSRQRYWGCPIPVIYCEKCGAVPVPESELPVLLPDDAEFTGKGNPLEKSASFAKVKCPACGAAARRETDTLDTFVDSSWYFLRYLDSQNNQKPFDSGIVTKYMPVDQYIGGIEHATMHLIYARFFTKALRDLGLFDFSEPFKRLLCQGMVLKDGSKMSKSKGNTVSVDAMLNEHGADAGRMFILFASPPERDLEWSDEGVRGCSRFLKKLWRLGMEAASCGGAGKSLPEKKELEFITAKTVAAVEKDFNRFQFNTAVSSIQELINFTQKLFAGHGNFEGFANTVKTAVKLVYPFAPFIASELAEILKIKLDTFPTCSLKAMEGRDKEIIIQINGKLRAKLTFHAHALESEIVRAACENEKILKFTEGSEIKKHIYVEGKILNLVIGGGK
ncbi:MAG: leucine--tRNA ligase [Elusimicrobia bacterium HGW-Elusimicrobia-2]|nr:MAG: leucine--tRNA ligase [Elusimicrobia bacterium HGW-Elusimicrobia-2]